MTITINKMQARDALAFLDELAEEIESIEDLKKEESYKVTETILDTQYSAEVLPYKEGTRMKGQVDTDKVYINNVEFSREELEEMLKDDIRDIVDFFKHLDVSDIENYVKELIHLNSIDSTFEFVNREIDEKNCRLKLSSHNLVNEAGICRAMLKDIRVYCTLSLTVNPQNGEQELRGNSIELLYEHSHGGRNGYTIGKVKYNPRIEVWYGYNYDKEKYEVI